MPEKPKNLLLRQLSPAHLQDVLKVAEFVHLDVREPILDPGKPIEFVDFPESGVISIVTPLDANKVVEIANVGPEGFVGVPIFLFVNSIPERAFCQVEGTAWRISSRNFQKLLKDIPELNLICRKYVATFLDQIATNTACNWVHPIEQRCSRWLLLAHDRVDGDQFGLTQEFLAMMLGVTRAGVNLAAGTLAKAGLISYSRGKITILDRSGLEQASCGCYRSLRNYFDQIIGS
jgi:CRP-like cAMP-binding protein